MKYMSAEWKDRLKHWMHTLQQDLYQPLGEISVEGFLTMEELSLQEASAQAFAPMNPGTRWGKSYEYCWLRGALTLSEAARGKPVVLDLKTGGETTVFVDGVSFGTYRAGWLQIPHHYIVDNWLTESGEPGRTYEIMLEAYAGHFFRKALWADAQLDLFCRGCTKTALWKAKGQHSGILPTVSGMRKRISSGWIWKL